MEATESTTESCEAEGTNDAESALEFQVQGEKISACSLGDPLAKYEETTEEIEDLKEFSESVNKLQRMTERIEEIQHSFSRLKEHMKEKRRHIDINFDEERKKIQEKLAAVTNVTPYQLLMAESEKLDESTNDIPQFSSEVTPSNPYSRLMALEKMGVVSDYAKIQEYTVAIIGVGGVGSVAAEMLTRCGIGKLVLFDYDKVEMANMNRMFYQPHHVGMYKVDAAAIVLHHIAKQNVIPKNINITTVEGFDHFLTVLKTYGANSGTVDLVLSCVDNYEARMAVNSACNELNIPWFESGVSENAVSGHIQYMMPGESACFACAPPLIVASSVDEKTLKREGVCAASLPTTMSVIAGLLVQNVLKKLLNFGEISWYLGYDSTTDFFPRLKLKPNPFCSDKYCVSRQEEYKKHLLENPSKHDVDDTAKKASDVIHEDNVYGITLISDSEGANGSSTSDKGQIAAGVRYEYPSPDNVVDDSNTIQETDQSLEQLMGQMKSL